MKPAVKIKFLLGAVGVGMIGGGIFYLIETHPESSPVTRGARLAETAGCYACHGASGDDPRVNFRLREDEWSDRSIAPIGEEDHSAKSIMTWVTHGVPESKRESHRQLLVQMPAYGDDGHLSPAEIADVTAWARAVVLQGFQGYDNREEDMPALEASAIAGLAEAELLTLGDRLSRQAGCYQCHGELGQGGPGNPASLKGYIPGFQGADFRDLTANADPAEIRHWIEQGRGQAIESGLLGRLARKFFEGQAIPMPAYEGILSETEIELLVAYLQWLNQRGPLDAAAIEALAEMIDENL